MKLNADERISSLTLTRIMEKIMVYSHLTAFRKMPHFRYLGTTVKKLLYSIKIKTR